MRLRRRVAAWSGRVPAALIGERYLVHLDERLGRVGGLVAYAAADQAGRRDLLALVAPSPRHRALEILREQWIPGLLTPLADGVCAAGHVIICRRPQGTALDATAPWAEDDLLYRVLRPVARCLVHLAQFDVVHGAIHPANLFGGGIDDVVSLGAGWAHAPGSVLPAAYRPITRSRPTAADDIHALGVSLLALWHGHKPRPDLDDAALVRERRAHGTADALLSGATVPPALDRLLRGMLADDPAVRPGATALADPCGLLGVAWAPIGLRPPQSGITTGSGWGGALPLGHATASALPG